MALKKCSEISGISKPQIHPQNSINSSPTARTSFNHGSNGAVVIARLPASEPLRSDSFHFLSASSFWSRSFICSRVASLGFLYPSVPLGLRSSSSAIVLAWVSEFGREKEEGEQGEMLVLFLDQKAGKLQKIMRTGGGVSRRGLRLRAGDTDRRSPTWWSGIRCADWHFFEFFCFLFFRVFFFFFCLSSFFFFFFFFFLLVKISIFSSGDLSLFPLLLLSFYSFF